MVHHVGKSNRINDLELLCPNCHYSEKAHIWVTKKDPWTGEKYPRLIKKRLGKKKVKKKRESKKPEKTTPSFL